jgi:hypothetical protein
MPATLVQDPRIAEDVYLKEPGKGAVPPRLWWVVRLKVSTEFGCKQELRLEDMGTGERVWRTDKQIREQKFELVTPDRSTGLTPDHLLLLDAKIAVAQAEYKASRMRRGSLPT